MVGTAPLKIAILISGRGSNMKALAMASRTVGYPAHIAGVISNRPGAPGLDIAASFGVSTQVIDHKAFNNRDNFDGALTKAIEDTGAELVCLAGFMRILGDGFVARWQDRLINIHPSLLPAFKGLDTHARAIAAGVRFTGCTVHFVRTEMDNGPIIAQSAVPVRADDTERTVADRVLEQEHRLYPLTVRWIAEKRVRVIGNNVIVDGRSAPEQVLINPIPA